MSLAVFRISDQIRFGWFLNKNPKSSHKNTSQPHLVDVLGQVHRFEPVSHWQLPRGKFLRQKDVWQAPLRVRVESWMTWHSKDQPRIHTHLNFYGIWMKSQNTARLWYEKGQFHVNPWTKCELVNHTIWAVHHDTSSIPTYAFLPLGESEVLDRHGWLWLWLSQCLELSSKNPFTHALPLQNKPFSVYFFFWNLRATASFKRRWSLRNSVAILASIFIPLFFCACLGHQTWDNKPLKH